jgi:hypothetical protein
MVSPNQIGDGSFFGRDRAVDVQVFSIGKGGEVLYPQVVTHNI